MGAASDRVDGWAGFAMWAASGALSVFAVLAGFTLGWFGIVIALIALGLTAWLARIGPELLGIFGGAGLLILGIGMLGTGDTRCRDGQIPAGASSCSTFDPTPWLLAGVLVAFAAFAAFAYLRARRLASSR